MVFFNYATMQMAAKIVYYGPGLCGKTTNLHFIYGRTAPGSRGEMVSLETETDRTLFFDLLPLDVGVISGFKTRLQLYTVPGQVFYNTTRKLVLKGVDGIVFVADSQRPMAEPNRESLKNLRENLAEIGVALDALPRVLQYNKRDLANILSVEEMNEALNQDRSIEWYEASATNGPGVFETLKAISKLTLRSLKSKMSADMRRPYVAVSPSTPSSVPVAVAADVSGISAAVAALDSDDCRPRSPFDSTMSRLQKFRELQAQQAVAAPPAARERRDFPAAVRGSGQSPARERPRRGHVVGGPVRRAPDERARARLRAPGEARPRPLERRHPLGAREAPEALDPETGAGFRRPPAQRREPLDRRPSFRDAHEPPQGRLPFVRVERAEGRSRQEPEGNRHGVVPGRARAARPPRDRRSRSTSRASGTFTGSSCR